MLRVVVLGTGTGVGKTRFTALLARALVALAPELRILAVKPIETGTRRAGDGRPARGTDAWRLEQASTATPLRPHPLFAFEPPISAHLASRRSGAPIQLPPIVRWLSDAALHDITLIETAGGAYSPLSPRAVNVDLAAALGAARWILVAPDSLGVLHDVRACWTAMTATHRAPDYLALSAARAPDASTGTNAAELPRVGLPEPIAVLPRGARSPEALLPLARALLADATTSRRPRSRVSPARVASSPRRPAPRNRRGD